MEKFKELLKNAGVTDVDAVLNQMKENKIYLSGEENIDIRYNKLKTTNESVSKQLEESKKTIEALKASQTTSEADKTKITEYETTVQALNEQLKKAQIESAVKVALLSAKAKDVDYLIYKMKEKDDLELDDHGNVKGIDDKLAGLKTQFPNQFEGGSGGTDKKFDEKKLNEGGSDDKHLTKADVLKMPYAKRAELFNKDPEQFKTIMRGEED